MAKLKNPLLSLAARNSIGKAISFVRRRGQNIAESRPEPDDVKSLAQLSWRHMYQKGVALWHALSAAEKIEWESLARSKHMTGFAWFMSQMLKPNPGLYLPLQGGTMQGAIQMDSHHIHGLPLPVHVQDVWRRQDFQDFCLPFHMVQGARAYHSLGLTIPNNTWTVLPLNSERYDTDSIHHLTVNSSRLTCQTAGKYVIVGQGRWAASALGTRRLLKVLLNGAAKIGMFSALPTAFWVASVVLTIWDLAVTDYVEMEVYQNTGGNLNIESDPNWSPEFMMQRIGP